MKILYIVLIIVAAVTMVCCFIIGSSFYNDHSDPYNGLYAVLFLWIHPVMLGVGIAALLSLVLI